MGLRLANLVLKDCDPTPSNREAKFNLEVRASRGIWMRAMAVGEASNSTDRSICFQEIGEELVEQCNRDYNSWR